MLRNASKAAELPLQLKKATGLLTTLQRQLATSKKASLKKVVQSGTASGQPEVENVKGLTENCIQTQLEVDELTRTISRANPTSSQGLN